MQAFREADRQAYGSDILNAQDFLSGNDFRPADLGIQLPFTVIVTNPPYSIKDAFIEECYRRGNPFALLMPLTAFEGLRRQKCYRENSLQVMFLPKRSHFETPNLGLGGKGAWFATAWFTYKLNLPSDLYFVKPEDFKVPKSNRTY